MNSNDRSCVSVHFLKAWIGAAFSLGFIFGPLLGALSSHLGTVYAPKSPVAFFIVPAIVSLLLSLINIAIVTQFCPETLPVAKRVSVAASYGYLLTRVSVLLYPGGQEDHGR
jgi:MFS family permease